MQKIFRGLDFLCSRSRTSSFNYKTPSLVSFDFLKYHSSKSESSSEIENPNSYYSQNEIHDEKTADEEDVSSAESSRFSGRPRIFMHVIGFGFDKNHIPMTKKVKRNKIKRIGSYKVSKILSNMKEAKVNTKQEHMNSKHSSSFSCHSSTYEEQKRCHNVTEFACSGCLCVCCPIIMLWSCVKIPCSIGWRLARKAKYNSCCRPDKKVFAVYSSFSDFPVKKQENCCKQRHHIKQRMP